MMDGPDQKPARVVVTDFDMPFGRMVVFMVKVAIASIPAAMIILGLAALIAGILGVFGVVLSTIGK